MAATKTLKEQNAWLIRTAMVVHMAAFAWVVAAPSPGTRWTVTTIAGKIEAAAVPGSASLGLIAITSLLLLGLLPSGVRDSLVHLRWRDPLPGCRAFSKVGPAANHVDMDAITRKFGPLPTEPSKQNQLFYRIYQDHRDAVGVLDAHRRYLAARDIGTITGLLVLPLAVLAFVTTRDVGRSLTYGATLFFAYLLCAVAAKNYGRRMIEHVLALAASAKKPARAPKKATKVPS